MKTIYIYKHTDEFNAIDKHTAETNDECEKWATDSNYDDKDTYFWAYQDFSNHPAAK
jgi:hypothetical protein